MQVLVPAINYTLLLAAMMYLYGVLITIYAELVQVEHRYHTVLERATGPYWYGWWLPITVYVLLPQLIWFKKFSASVKFTYTWFWCALVMAFLEYYPLMVSTLYRDYIPSSWAYFFPSFTGIWGSLGIFIVVLAAIYAIVSNRNKDLNVN